VQQEVASRALLQFCSTRLENADTALTPGSYHANENTANVPVLAAAALEVIKVGTAVLQRFTTWAPTPIQWGRQYQLATSTWSAWKQSAYTKGESSLSVDTMYEAGVYAITPTSANNPTGA
jgi:hypothetical protein